nr:C-type lectin domain family 12 member B-like isoform X5 [Caretta caretta]
MTEEITYADLEFNKPYALENIPKPAAPEEKGRPTSSPTWRLAALTFLTLCLALLVGLLALGIVFFQVSSDFQKQIGNLKQNQETLQTSSSKRLQDMKDNLCLKGEEKNKNNGPNCTLCPANWQWMGGDTCFYISREKRIMYLQDRLETITGLDYHVNLKGTAGIGRTAQLFQHRELIGTADVDTINVHPYMTGKCIKMTAHRSTYGSVRKQLSS